MAKAPSKKAKAGPTKHKAKKPASLSKSALIAGTTGITKAANVNITFAAGLGQVTASLFRRGVLINMQSISSSGAIHFSDVQGGDSISVNGICSGTADITVTVPTNPATPEHFTAGVMMTGYTIL